MKNSPEDHLPGCFFLDVQATYLSRIRALASQLRSLASRPFSCMAAARSAEAADLRG